MLPSVLLCSLPSSVVGQHGLGLGISPPGGAQIPGLLVSAAYTFMPLSSARIRPESNSPASASFQDEPVLDDGISGKRVDSSRTEILPAGGQWPGWCRIRLPAMVLDHASLQVSSAVNVRLELPAALVRV